MGADLEPLTQAELSRPQPSRRRLLYEDGQISITTRKSRWAGFATQLRSSGRRNDIGLVGHTGRDAIDWIWRRLFVTLDIFSMRPAQPTTSPYLMLPNRSSTRRTWSKVCGLVSAWTVSEQIEFGAHHADRGAAVRFALRELDCLRVLREIQAPDYFLSILAVSEAGNYRLPRQCSFVG